MSTDDTGEPRSPIRVLLVDDSDAYVRSILAMLAGHAGLEVVGRASTGDAGISLGRELAPNVVVLDLSLPDISGWEVAEALGRAHPGTRIVFLSSHDAAHHRDAARTIGAAFVHKGEAARELVRAVLRQAQAPGDEVGEQRWLAALQESEERFRATFEHAAVGISHVSPDGRWLRVNQALCDILGRSRLELLEQRFQDVTHPDNLDGDLEAVDQLLAGEVPSYTRDKRYLHKNGSVVWARLTVSLVRTPSGAPEYFITVTQDITQNVHAEEARHEVERLLLESQAVAHIGSWGLDLSTRRLSWSEETYRLYGVSPSTFDHSMASFLRLAHPEDRQAMEAWMAAVEAGEKVPPLDFRTVLPDGRVRHLRRQGVLLSEEGRPARIVGTTQDTTEQRSMEAQLRHAQKMEAVGRLAGGVAHDFNNILTVILSYSDYGRSALPDGDPLRDDLEEIHKAGERAAALTRQLLTFSRRQPVAPQVVALNQLVAELNRMLLRLMGEDITLVQKLEPDLGAVRADPGQLEQVITNLVVNARDAMPQGGSLTIETSNVEVDQDYAAQHLSVKPGPFVLLAVSDTGEGMDQATRQRLFEPFFTTKEQGKGTGLGLSTVYGIVKQSGGEVLVYSEPRLGTTFKIYLPRVEGHAAVAERQDSRPAIGDETILLVEDEEAVRKLTIRILREAGFRVLPAANGAEACLAAERHRGEIQLLLTDVVMPQMSGPQLAARLTVTSPGLRVLYMSGYAGDAIIRQGVPGDGTTFIDKPFSAATLRRKVRDVLDAP